jgi:hypothetical protein
MALAGTKQELKQNRNSKQAAKESKTGQNEK